MSDQRDGATKAGKWMAGAASGLNSGAQLTAQHLSLFCDENYQCWPSVGTLAEMSGRDERTIRRNLATLEEAGVIVRNHRRNQSTVFVIPVPVAWSSPSRSHTSPPPVTHDTSPVTRDTPTPDTGVRSPLTPTSGQGGHPCQVEEPLEEPLEESPSPPASNGSPDAAATAVAGQPTLTLIEEPPPTPDRFEEFWEVYGYKKNRKAAKRAWDKATKRTSPEKIIGSARTYIEYRKAKAAQEGKPDWQEHTAHPATWLNGERWEDEVVPLDQQQVEDPHEVRKRIQREEEHQRRLVGEMTFGEFARFKRQLGHEPTPEEITTEQQRRARIYAEVMEEQRQDRSIHA